MRAPGAEAAVLQLRAPIDNGNFDAYWALHPAREHQRRYPTLDQHNYELAA